MTPALLSLIARAIELLAGLLAPVLLVGLAIVFGAVVLSAAFDVQRYRERAAMAHRPRWWE